MDILQTISANLNAWMRDTPGLRTIEEVVTASGVGFGTVRRIRKGEINATIQNLEAIAKAFKRQASDLLALPSDAYQTGTASCFTVNEPPAPVITFRSDDDDPLITEAAEILRGMSEHGKRVALKHLKLIAEEHSIPKQTTAFQ